MVGEKIQSDLPFTQEKQIVMELVGWGNVTELPKITDKKELAFGLKTRYDGIADRLALYSSLYQVRKMRGGNSW
jgi:hypothetical protein